MANAFIKEAPMMMVTAPPNWTGAAQKPDAVMPIASALSPVNAVVSGGGSAAQ